MIYCYYNNWGTLNHIHDKSDRIFFQMPWAGVRRYHICTSSLVIWLLLLQMTVFLKKFGYILSVHKRAFICYTDSFRGAICKEWSYTWTGGLFLLSFFSCLSYIKNMTARYILAINFDELAELLNVSYGQFQYPGSSFMCTNIDLYNILFWVFFFVHAHRPVQHSLLDLLLCAQI